MRTPFMSGMWTWRNPMTRTSGTMRPEMTYTIVSKDSDFHQQSFLRGHPPKVVWVRVGNCSTNAIISLLRLHHDAVLKFEQDETVSFLTLE